MSNSWRVQDCGGVCESDHFECPNTKPLWRDLDHDGITMDKPLVLCDACKRRLVDGEQE